MNKSVKELILTEHYKSYRPNARYIHEKITKLYNEKGIKAPCYRTVCKTINEAEAKMPRVIADMIMSLNRVPLSKVLPRL